MTLTLSKARLPFLPEKELKYIYLQDHEQDKDIEQDPKDKIDPRTKRTQIERET